MFMPLTKCLFIEPVNHTMSQTYYVTLQFLDHFYLICRPLSS